ncbi:MAG TPA: cupredoxin domain-containing protein [Actinomycetota bacterium]|nr:cupredoxin domain-containing protein [Actinomycetota bacterium]
MALIWKISGGAVAAMLAAVLLGAFSPSRERTVEITIHHSRFRPATVEVSPGTTVRFVLRNTDPIDHEFILGDEEVQARHEAGTEAHHGAIPGEVSVPAGEEASTTYIFTEPGTLLIGCHLPGHYAYGMRGSVRVG